MKISVLSLLMLLAGSVYGQQVSWGGNIDFEYRNGGENSSPLLNQTPGKAPSLFIPNARLFASVDFDEHWFIDATLQTDTYGQAELHPVFFSLLNINWMPLANQDFKLQAGRIIIPFGLDHKRFIAPKNPFANLGFDSNWNLRVDKKHGFLAGGPLSYSGGKPGQAIVYQRRYTQGIAAEGSFGESKWMEYTLALTTAPASGFQEYNQHAAPSFIGRTVFRPFMWLKTGFSATHGSYMHRMPGVNDALSDRQLGHYKQTAWAADVTFDYAWFALSAQYTRSLWTAPRFLNPVPSFFDKPFVDERLRTDLFQVETVVNLPMLPGTWLGGRYERMLFSEFDPGRPYNPDSTSLSVPRRTWMPNWNRFEIVMGKKLQRNVIGKISYQAGDNAGIERGDRVFTLQLTTLF